MATAEAARKLLPERSSRGTRIRQLIGEEAEADESFWGQDAWREDEEDDDYSTEDGAFVCSDVSVCCCGSSVEAGGGEELIVDEEEDVADSDFDEQENPDDEVHDEDEDNDSRRRRAKAPQRGAYREPKLATRNLLKKPRLVVATDERSLITQQQPQTRDGATPATPTAVFQYETPTVRRSTARKSSESSELRKKTTEEAARLALRTRRFSDAKTANSNTGNGTPTSNSTTKNQRLTQAQLLAEAVRTEVENIQSLSRLEQLEEEKKAESITPKAPFTGQMVRYHSRIGAPKTITFLNTIEFPALFNQQKPKKRERPEGHNEEEDDDEDQEEPQETEQEERDEFTPEAKED